MTTTLHTPVAAAPRRSALRPSGLVWTVLRLHRTALFVWLAFVAFTAVFMLWLYGPGASAAQDKLDAFGYAGVLLSTSSSHALLGFTSGAYNDLFYDPGTLITLASFGVALFAAGPLTARELEFGTAQLVWGQSPSPARWLATKLAMPALLVTAGMTVLTVLYRLLWNAHGNLLIAGIGPRAFYFSVGPATVAAPLLGLALGALAGLAVRRTLPALALAGFGYFLVNAFRTNAWPFQGRYRQPEVHSRSWAITSKGTEIPDPGCYDDRRCLAKHDIAHFGREYLHSSDYWPRQLLETGVLLALTALAVTAAFLVLRRRTV
ncbi:hypothetical protein GCM10022403_088820 [Streptomyces coacervatus]|uniref:ABC transporter permease n=1 Tax=Streptomyces coacervatus TaxID=647381 RepID=A0ABP7JFB1_9ACTN|nr:hypothetical protein [Streptomyces coacervatus]MDF2271270.1 hypothetical protein [Streptomyces coacervatus]